MFGPLLLAAIIAVILISIQPVRELFSRYDTGIRVNAGRVITLHYTTWCGGCKMFRPTWDLAKKNSDGSGITFVEVDEDKANTPGIDMYPTVMMLDEYGHTIKYTGGNSVDQLLTWAITPLPT